MTATRLRRPTLALSAALAAALLPAGLTACGGNAGTAGVTVDAGATRTPSGTGTSSPARSARPTPTRSGATASATPTADPGPVEVTGTAFRFTLPTGAYRPDPLQVTDTAATVRRWRLPLDARGTACVVVVGEQPDYRGSFPAVQLAAFGAGRGRGSEVVTNEVTAPPQGAVAAVAQELRFVLRRADGGTAPARLFARQFLTPGRTLVSIDAAAPDDAAGRCRPQSVVASLLPTGQEYTAPAGAPTSESTTEPNGSPTGGAP